MVAIDFRLPLSDLPCSSRLADRDDLPSRISFNDLSRSFRLIVRMLIRIISGPTLSSPLDFVLSGRFFHRLPLAKYMRTSAKLMVDVIFQMTGLIGQKTAIFRFPKPALAASESYRKCEKAFVCEFRVLPIKWPEDGRIRCCEPVSSGRVSSLLKAFRVLPASVSCLVRP